MSGTKTITRYGEKRLIAKSDRYGESDEPRYIEVIGKGRRAYLWIGSDDGPALLTVSGPKTLRKLARAILDEVGHDD